ncbi:EAL domain-containing protein [Algisphaera agarilytica]|uniref:Diguanylate cyclase (GGDEF)-like protein n=1 Tax=Algisphaera agarilytica TaxID=1385975 RepID=A0A7X0H5Y8_9BACT|nr:EAL domain-containing protein [Algisphaera agarilytica]MBB6428721.1 diguanylate cyclase (GGDEF)-like protein [Algisphaera agarilytica]
MSQIAVTEKRRHGRYRPDGLACNLGQVVDLSQGGMRLLSKRERHGHQTVTLDTSEGQLMLQARVAWRRKLASREYVLGMTFEELPVQDRDRLEALVREIKAGRSQSTSGEVGGSHWWMGVATAFVGVGLVALGRAFQNPDAWAFRWFPEHAESLNSYAPFIEWGAFIIGGLLVLTGLSEMRRRPSKASAITRPSTPRSRRTDQDRPVRDMKQLHQSHYLLNCILESALGGVGVLKAVRDQGEIVDFEIQLVNRAAENILGKVEPMLVGKRLSKALPCVVNHSMFQEMVTAVRTGLPLQKEYRLENGRWMQMALVQLGDGLAVTFTDTTERHHAQARLRHVAYHDELTGLPNRKLLMEHLEQAMVRAQNTRGRKFAVLFLDFDRFKIVNDTLGHDVGDMLLNSISQRLRENIREADTAAVAGQQQLPARLGGDEFVVMLDGIAGEEDAIAVARRLLHTFNKPHQLGPHQVVSTASIGIAMSSPDYISVDDLLRDADTAMYEAKNSGKARYVMFDQQMHDTLIAQAKLERDLRDAVATEDFSLVYEPIVDLSSGRIAGFEALIRWNHEDRGEVPPAEFVPLAEELNLIGPVGEWVVKRACIEIARWRDAGREDVFLNINLSRAQLYDGDLIGLLQEQIETHGLDPKKLSLEITETMVVNDVAEMGEKLLELKKLGVKLALDDFGTGHSSLNVLQELPLDILKIDRTFIANAGDAVRRYGAIIATITELAQNLDMQVIAEGIERPEQVSLLQGLACDYAQGWLFSHAVEADTAKAMLMDNPSFDVAA